MTRAELNLAHDEPEPALRTGQMLVQFFNDNNRFEVMDRKNVKLYYIDTAAKINKGYDGPYAMDLNTAVEEMMSYAKEIGWDKSRANDVSVSPQKKLSSAAAEMPKKQATVARQASSKIVSVKQKEPSADAGAGSISVDDDETPHPVLTDIDDVRVGADAADVEFVFKQNDAEDEHANDDGFVVTARPSHSNIVETELVQQSVDAVQQEDEVIDLDGGNARQSARDSQKVAKDGRQSTKTAQRDTQQGNGRASSSKGSIGRKAATPTAGGKTPASSVRVGTSGNGRISGSRQELMGAPRKEPHSDDTSTESMPINSGTGDERAEDSGAPSNKRTAAHFQGDENALNSKDGGGGDARRPRKRKKKSGTEDASMSVEKGTIAATSKVSRGEMAKVVEKAGSRNVRGKKTTKLVTGDKPGGDGGKIVLSEQDLVEELRRRDEVVSALQKRLERLEGSSVESAGQLMVRSGMELIQPAKEMMKSAQEMLRSAHDMIREGQELLRRNG